MSQQVKAIPDGHPRVTPHLVIAGAPEAIEFYKTALGAREMHRMLCPQTGKIMHASIAFGDSMIYLAEEFPNYGSLGPKAVGGSPVVIHLYVEDVDAAFNQAVEAGATPVMPPMDMFWGDRYGKFVDPFGHQWSLATHIEDLTPEQMNAKMREFMSSASCGASDSRRDARGRGHGLRPGKAPSPSR